MQLLTNVTWIKSRQLFDEKGVGTMLIGPIFGPMEFITVRFVLREYTDIKAEGTNFKVNRTILKSIEPKVDSMDIKHTLQCCLTLILINRQHLH